MKNEWWIVVDKNGYPCSARETEHSAEVQRASLEQEVGVFRHYGPHRAVRVVPAEEVEALRADAEARIAAAVAAERERCARVAEESTAYTAFQGVEHYKLASAIAHAIREPKS